MATSFGIDPIVTETTVKGTTSADIRQIFGAMFNFNQGVLQGAKVTTNNSMTYTISSGLVLNYVEQGGVTGHILTPVYDKTITAPKSSVATTHYIYVKQNLEAVDGNNDITYGVSTSAISALADARLHIATFKVPANMTRTTQATFVNDGNRSSPLWATGSCGYIRDTYNGKLSARTNNAVSLVAQIPQGPREIQVTITSNIGAVNPVKVESMYYNLYINGRRVAIFSGGLITHTDGKTHTFTWRGQGGGNTTVKLEYWSRVPGRNPSVADNKKSSLYFNSNATGWHGTTMEVTDLGPVKG